jgi:hypothetical protein
MQLTLARNGPALTSCAWSPLSASYMLAILSCQVWQVCTHLTVQTMCCTHSGLLLLLLLLQC